jgi:hypothetical protein
MKRIKVSLIQSLSIGARDVPGHLPIAGARAVRAMLGSSAVVPVWRHWRLAREDTSSKRACSSLTIEGSLSSQIMVSFSVEYAA